MQQDYITLSLGLPEFRVLGVHEDEHHIIIYLEKKVVLGICPQCGRASDSIHYRRTSDIQDIPLLLVSPASGG
jgi:transposase